MDTKGGPMRKGLRIRDNITVSNLQSIYIDEGRTINDPLMLSGLKWASSAQPEYTQPAIQLGYDYNNHSDSGIAFNWWSVKPFGSLDLGDAALWAKDVEDKLYFGWVSWDDYFGGAKEPAFFRRVNNSPSSGIVFARKSLVLFGTSAKRGGNWRRYYGDEDAWYGDYVN